MKKKYVSKRYFTVFDFQRSHGQLLIRSCKNEAFDTNIDIIFFGVQFIQLFTNLWGVSIKLSEDQDIVKYELVRAYLKHGENNLFEITSGKQKYYVAASFVKVFENNLEYEETSLGALGYVGRGTEIQ